MILLLNTKITSNRWINYRHQVGSHYPNNNRVDIFKYCLASYAVMDPLISKYVFFIEISPEFSDRFEEIKLFIEETFPSDKLILSWKRNNSIAEWVNVCSLVDTIDDNIIWLACNDDHIFVDSNLDIVNDSIDVLKNDPDPMATVYYSHFPESIKLANHLSANLVDSGNFVKYNWSRFDAIQIIKNERLKAYWIGFNDNSREWHKPDEMVFTRFLPSTFYTPTKEIVRHFDGYGHVGNFSNITPSMCIPPGFFDSNIKIRYGFDGHLDNWVSLNPSSSNLYSIDPNGSDYRWCIKDIPLFWKSRISETNINETNNEEHLREMRNSYYVESTKMCPWAYDITFDQNNIPPIDWFKKHFL
jgi:hypothetical protein